MTQLGRSWLLNYVKNSIIFFMLRGIYAPPTDFESMNTAPGVTRREKLEAIGLSLVALRCFPLVNIYHVGLPYVQGASFSFESVEEYGDTLRLEKLNVGDKELYRQGIGSRLVRAMVRYGTETRVNLAHLTVGNARLGTLNTTVRIFGQEAVSAHLYGKQYGRGTEVPLEHMFDEVPPEPDHYYPLDGVDVVIDRDKAAAWEMPVKVDR
jgi:hypothetical protein